MPGGATTTQQQTQASQTSPWAPAAPALQNILTQAGNVPNTPNSAQVDAISQMEANAAQAPNFGGQATNVANTLLSGGPTNYSGILNSGYSTLQNQLSPYASGSMVGNNKALQGQLDVAANDVTNQINSQFAAAGRPAGTNADVSQAVARGVTQAQAPIIAGQYNQDVQNQINAANQLYGAAGSTAAGLTGITQTQLGNELQGLGAAGAVPGILNQNATSLLNAGNIGQALPYQGLGMLSSIVNPIAGMGGTSFGTGGGQTTQQQSLASTLLGAGFGGLGLLGGTGAFGASGWLNPSGVNPQGQSTFALSDERAKEDIARVGALDDGSNVYAFKYRGDPAKRTHIGLVAQEVEERTPEAVTELNGVKFVDYRAATAPARAIGILNDFAWAWAA